MRAVAGRAHRLPLAETQTGFQLMAAAGDSMKIVIEPQK